MLFYHVNTKISSKKAFKMHFSQSVFQAWKFCIFWERRSEPKKIQEPKKTKKKEMKRGERERKEKRGERE